jgi:hypothetical protein
MSYAKNHSKLQTPIATLWVDLVRKRVWKSWCWLSWRNAKELCIIWEKKTKANIRATTLAIMGNIQRQ